MDIQTIAINKVHPAPYNPRIELKPGDPEYDRLAQVIAEFDLVEPLVWNEQTGNLVSGHQRLKILKARGDKTVKVSVINVDLEREKALNVALNKTGGDWDLEQLAYVLADIEAAMDPELTGFSIMEIADIAAIANHTGSMAEYAALIDAPVKRQMGEVSKEIVTVTLRASKGIITREIEADIRARYAHKGIAIESTRAPK